MSKHRQAARIDEDQNQIIEDLLKIPGMTVERNHDDVLLGLLGFTFWIEIKSKSARKKSGGYRKGAIKKSQVKISETFTGHYLIASSYNEILQDMIAFFDRLKPYNYVSENLRRFLKDEKTSNA